MAHIRKYDFDYARRHFMEKTARGFGSAGVLGALWPIISEGKDVVKAYPEELTNIEAYTKGKVKPGDWIDKDNIELVQDLVDPALFQEVTQDGRKFQIIETTKGSGDKFYPHEFLEATIKNQGRGVIDKDGNTMTDDGTQWLGGCAFPDAQDGIQVISNMTLSWGRHDESMYAVLADAVNAAGDVVYNYKLVWAELAASGRTADPRGTMLPGDQGKGKLRYQSTWFTEPNDVKGTAFLSIWPYDQRGFPDLFGYLPAFKRVRRFPTNQRFEPLVAGLNFYLSDAWAAGDPYLTWGNYKIVGRQPYLGSSGNGWMGDLPNWRPESHGGPKGKTYFTIQKELIPEVVILEAEPTGFPRAPYSKKRVFVDARMWTFPQMLTYDRRNQLFKCGEPGFGQYKTASNEVLDRGKPAWSWTWYHSHDFQGRTMSRFNQTPEAGGYKSGYNNGDYYEPYMTEAAMRRLGT